MTRMVLPDYILKEEDDSEFARQIKEMVESAEKSFGVIVNSFYGLEQIYADHYKLNGRKAWLIGPLSLFNKDIEEKVNRGKEKRPSGYSGRTFLREEIGLYSYIAAAQSSTGTYWKKYRPRVSQQESRMNMPVSVMNSAEAHVSLRRSACTQARQASSICETNSAVVR